MKLNRSAVAWMLFSVGFSLGCSADSHQRVPLPAQDVTVTRADLTRIYFVRDDGASLHSREILVVDGEMEIGALTSDTYLCWERGGGRTLGRAFYQAIDPSKGRVEGSVDLDCAAGRAYYFNVTIDREGGKPKVALLDVDAGKALVLKRHPAEPH